MKKRVLIIYLLLWVQVAQSQIFKTPDFLEKSVKFWQDIYSKYDSNQIVFYDEINPDLKYFVLDLPKVPNQISSVKYKKQIKQEFEKIKNILTKISNKTGDEELKKSKLYKNIYQKLFSHDLVFEKNIPKQLRWQNGLKSQFAMGLKISGRYVEDIKKVLKAFDLPTDLVALIFVESLFYLPANSHAGAGGPWGFVKNTAQQFGLQVNSFVDERVDPVLATYGAAKYLKKSQDNLKSWPLTITSYNYGYPGILRARKNLNTSNFEYIIKNHESPLFGYASKNYYAEFLAALEVYSNKHKYFPKINYEKPWDYELVEILRPLNIIDAYNYNVIDRNKLKKLNPSFTKLTIKGKEVLPPNYSFRVPNGQSKNFYKFLKKVPRELRQQAGQKVSKRYESSGTESLYKIAKKTGIRAELLSNRFKKPASYRPKGPVLLRSQDYRFSRLKQIMSKILVYLSPP